MIHELKRYQRRRERLKRWWLSERPGFGQAEREKWSRAGYGTTLLHLDMECK